MRDGGGEREGGGRERERERERNDTHHLTHQECVDSLKDTG